MKKYAALFAAVALSCAIATAARDEKKGDGSFDPRRCFKLCMKELDDRDKRTYVCDPENRAQEIMRREEPTLDTIDGGLFYH